jgi:hypothetical protein
MANPDTMPHARTPEEIFPCFITTPLDFISVGVNLDCIPIVPLSKRRYSFSTSSRTVMTIRHSFLIPTWKNRPGCCHWGVIDNSYCN